MVPPANAVRRAIRRAEAGRQLDAAEAEVLLRVRGDDLRALTAAATAVRDARLRTEGRPGTITYSRKVFIPLTRLCRDRCHYCAFATSPARVSAPFLERDQVVEIARAGAVAGCHEALFTLGDRPEDRWQQAAEWLAHRGYSSTLEYLRACAIAVLEETGLLPHLNPGVLTWTDLQRLRPVAPSMGMMLETTATRLWSEPGGPHFGSPDKDPAVRLRVLQDAGRVGVPFTSGILIGIGETTSERVDSLFALRRVARQYGGLQEVIVQNFRAKPNTPMHDVPDAELDELVATIAVARLVLPPSVAVQAPPNLVDGQFRRVLAAGIDDWGGVSPVTPDHVNLERPWPDLDELSNQTAAVGLTLRPRLTVYPRYVLAGEPWIDVRMLPYVEALCDPGTGLATDGAMAVGRHWQEPDGGTGEMGRTDLHRGVDEQGRTSDRRSDFDEIYGDWAMLREAMPEPSQRAGHRQHEAPGAAGKAAGTPVVPQGRGAEVGPGGRSGNGAGGNGNGGVSGNGGGGYGNGGGSRLRPEVLVALAAAERNPAALSDAQALSLLDAREGPELEAVVSLADALRAQAVGETVTFVVNRNVNFTNVCYVGCRFCAFAQRRSDPDAYALSLEQVAARVREAVAVGATEICMQGGISPDLAATSYFDLARTVKAAAPDIHLHAFSPMEVVTGAARAGMTIADFLAELRDAGVDTLPGTAAEILDDDVRWVLTKGKLPASLWVETVTTAHRLGIGTTATMMYGHVDHPRHWLAHLRLIAGIQAETGGFSEFVPLPFVHHSAPLYLAGIARPGPTCRENRLVHAMARVLLHGKVQHIQCSWVKLGTVGCQLMLSGGADDLGGTLMEETISRMAGSEHGSSRTAEELAAIAVEIGRPARQRTTGYGIPTTSVLSTS